MNETQRLLKWLDAVFRDAHSECLAWRRWHSGSCREQWDADCASRVLGES